jgi:hypothetical protein
MVEVVVVVKQAATIESEHAYARFRWWKCGGGGGKQQDGTSSISKSNL